MGDRSSIIIRQRSCDDKGIEIYGHWAGTQICQERLGLQKHAGMMKSILRALLYKIFLIILLIQMAL